MLFSIQEIAEQLQSSRFGKKVVFCSGSFDILHEGHLNFLRQAKSHGDILVVAVNSDIVVSSRKGPTRPVMSEKTRSAIVCALGGMVDFVFIKQPNQTKEDIISILKPDVVVFCNDNFRSEKHVERCINLERLFPYVIFIISVEDKRTEGWSTTEIIEKIKKS